MFKYNIKIFLRDGSVQLIPSYKSNLETCEEVDNSLTPSNEDDNTWLKFTTDNSLLKIRYKDITVIQIEKIGKGSTVDEFL